MVEFPMGRGTVLAAQASLCDDFKDDARARILLINALAYLLGERHQLRRSFLYGAAEQPLHTCIAALQPRAAIAPVDLAGVEVLLVPAGWRAPQMRDAASLAPLARVGSFLRDGGTLLLIDPQPLVADYLSSLLGETVEFDLQETSRGIRPVGPTGAARELLQGIASEDLRLLSRRGREEFRLLSHRATQRLEPLLIIPGLTVYRVGRGTLVALALPETDACVSPRASSLIARILTNLGVPLGADAALEKQARSLWGNPLRATQGQ